MPDPIENTIVALSTVPGVSAIAVIRLSGPDTFPIMDRVFKGKKLGTVPSHTLHFGTIINAEGAVIDEVVVGVFRSPQSYTREDMAEISCHGSPFIIKEIIKLLLNQGAHLARPGEFTQRAFMNGRFDLAQAEAVADLIHSENETAHKTALDQMRGGFSSEIAKLRESLIHFASMIELELDFGEEDVEFASRDDLRALIDKILLVVNRLLESFDLGNAIKNGISTVIAGKPNAGKSTLMNALVQEEKAIVSEIPGTTRDFIEDEVTLGGLTFRFVDTAGLRESTDIIETMGVSRTREKMKTAAVIIYLFDLSQDTREDIEQESAKLQDLSIPVIKVGNKVDIAKPDLLEWAGQQPDYLLIAAGKNENLDQLKEELLRTVSAEKFKTGNTIVTNMRHYEGLSNTRTALLNVIKGLDETITNDFLAMEIRQALHHLGTLTGQITTDDLLQNIFSKFCIGK